MVIWRLLARWCVPDDAFHGPTAHEINVEFWENAYHLGLCRNDPRWQWW